METYKVIFHVSEMTKWQQVLANVTNLLKDLSEASVEVVILANGEAVKYFDSSNEPSTSIDKMTKLNSNGVVFTACNHSLTGHSISNETLYSFVEIVPAGVSELVRKQHEGFSYIKP